MPHKYNLRPLPHREHDEQDKINRFFDTHSEYKSKVNESITVFIKTLMGQTFEISINKDILFLEFFELLAEKTDINIITFYLVYNHYRMPKFEEITSKMRVSDFNVRDNSNLHLVLRLGCHQSPFVYNKSDWFKFS